MASESLTYIISLIDRASAPLRGIRQQVSALSQTARAGASQVAMGTAALWAAGQALKGGLEPAIEMQRALGEVRSLGVAENALNDLKKSALSFSVQYGTSAADFVRASYDIQSAIAGLSGRELTSFTTASGVLAKATKSDVGTITAYMGTMYGIFKNTADQMGKAQWVEQIAGQTASAVQLFKTTGNEMSSAFTALGAAAQKAGASSAEQFAVLGQLQSTMSGSEAGTKYKSFLAGIGGAQKTLGLKFTNNDGTMKSVVEIMTLIQGKFGDISKVADSDLLKKAFGSDEAVAMIKLLSSDIDGLKANVNSLGAITGMDKAREMALAMVDSFEQLAAGARAVQIVLGGALMPVLKPLIDRMTGLTKQAVIWLQKFPNIARWIAIVTASIVGATAAGAAFSVMLGGLKLAGAGIRLAGIFTGITPLFKLLARGAGAILNFSGALRFFRNTLFAARLALLSFGGSLAAVTAPIWGLVALIALAVGAVVVAVVKFWNPIKAFFSGFITGFVQAAQKSQALQGVIAALGPVFSAVCSVVSWLWNGLKSLCGWFGDLLTPIQYTENELSSFSDAGSMAGSVVAAAFDAILFPVDLLISAVSWLVKVWPDVVAGWNSVCAAFSEFSFADAFRSGVESVGQMFSGLWDSIAQQFYGVYNGIVEQLNKLPGVNIELKGRATPGQTGTAAQAASVVAAIPGAVSPAVAPVPGAVLPPGVAVSTAAPVPGVASAFVAPAPPPSPAVLRGGVLDPGVASVSSRTTKTTNNINNSRSVGNVNVYVQQAQDAQQIAELAEMSAG